jgi:hypothetical protein
MRLQSIPMLKIAAQAHLMLTNFFFRSIVDAGNRSYLRTSLGLHIVGFAYPGSQARGGWADDDASYWLQDVYG